MACFLIPMTLAILTSIIQKTARTIAEKLKLWLLNALLWGGSLLLALEHVWHGEVVPWPPFLTAMSTPEDIPVMLHEMATAGTAMSIVTCSAWASILILSTYIPKMRIHRLTMMKAIEQQSGIPMSHQN
ncbi:hypothetical protein [Candidatus Culexarchaeum yellowstonense]|uniref:hypothetical protein n=1 Tax=Candidatus Culexarchaeum yellowstonense TaxID=2928963 RepID=UPI0026F08C9C|nr:hypothetical protein [Candidatus Culexarchaeum yellowstonense]